ncbi:MAG TPA: amidohydrolase [Caldimonas sp.]|nr:amidohydrolase [Caldimonas sp.]
MISSPIGVPTLQIRNALLITGEEREEPFFGWIEVHGRRIGRVERGDAPAIPGVRVIDAEGGALLPGLVNAHAHSHSSLTRGSAEGMTLERWIDTIEREQSRLTDEDAYVAALATYGEALLSGTTSIVDMCLRPRPAMRAARALGIRVAIAPYVLDGRAFAPTLDDVEALLRDKAARGGTVDIWVGLHDLESCADDTVRRGAQMARDFGTGLHLHCSESRFSVDRTLRRTGMTPIAHLQALGALGPRTLLAHCVWADGDDRAILARTATRVAHCPHANLKLASGFAPVPAMIDAGIKVALATDGAKANNRLDMFDVMKFASLLHRGVALDASVISPAAVLGMATHGGALGQEGGSIAPGRVADLILVDVRQFHLQPAVPSTIETNLVHSARGSDVRTVIVDGEVVVEDGQLVRLPMAPIVDSMRATADRLMAHDEISQPQ